MSVMTALTGSYPPLPNATKSDPTEDVLASSIQNAIQQQIAAGVEVLSDGQCRSNIVGIFAHGLGLIGNGLPYYVTRTIESLSTSVILPDLETAHAFAGGRPLKAHLTGPTVIAESTLERDAPDCYRGVQGFRRLTLDLAHALAQEARLIGQRAQTLNIGYLQIDEPSLAFGADLGLAREALAIIVEAWKAAGGGPTLAHVCGDIGDILPGLVALPIDILSIESVHLREVEEAQRQVLLDSDKKLALGVVPVNSASVPSASRVARELLHAEEDFGADRIWGVTPNCGLRLSEEGLAVRRMTGLTEAARLAHELDRDLGIEA